MANYDFNKLLDSKTFEFLGKDILEVRENLKFEVFSEGKDQGIDIRYEDKEILIIGQVKRYREFDSLYNDLKNKELKKVEKLNPNRYIIITSVSLTPSRKAKIKELFSKYVITTSDIIGETELNTYLGSEQYKYVEEAYSQLWINSSNVLKNIIKKEIHSEIHNKTKIVFKEIQESSSTYVKNDCFGDCLKKIEKRKCLLICGEPGIGKTTLAYNLISNFITKYKETGFIALDKINDFYKVYNDEQKQLFLIDDFWGIKFSDDQKSIDLKKVIEIITKSDNKYLILTSREYILKQGYLEYPELESFFDRYKIKLNIEDFSDLFKARILFRNLENSELNYDAIYQLANYYGVIINNSNYSPRVINAYLDHLNDIEYEVTDYEKDIIKYLNNPQELWKEIFSKQSEGAQLLAFLILLFSNPVKLEDIKELFYNCLDNNYRINARKKEFSNYISQLENTIITTYTDEFYEDNNIYFRFKNSSMELYVYSHFNEVIDEYGECIIKSSKYLNNLLRLSNCNNSLSYDYGIDYNVKNTDFNINEKFQNMIIDKIINEFDKLDYIDEEEIKEAYIEKGSCVQQVIEIMYLYEQTKIQKLKSFIYIKTERIMEDFYENQYFNYNDSLILIYMIEINMKFNIGNKFNIEKVFERYWEIIRFSRQLLSLKWNEENHPEEYKKSLNGKDIKSFVINLTIDDAKWIYDEILSEENKEDVYAIIDELTELTIPELFRLFKIKYAKWYVREIYDLTKHKLFDAKKEWLDELENESQKDFEYENEEDNDEYEKKILSREEELKIIENEREELLNNYYNNYLEETEIQDYLNANLKNKELVSRIMELYNIGDYCITPLLIDYNKIEFLKSYLKYRNKVDKNIPEFFDGIIAYLKDRFDYINNDTIKVLKEIAYDTLKNCKKVMYESQILKYISIDELEDLKESKIIYNRGKKYYFITEELHIVFGIYGSININESLISIFDNIFSTDNYDFCDYFNDIFCIYSDIDTNKFNKEFLYPILQEFVEKIKDENKTYMVKKFINFIEVYYNFSTKIDELNEEYANLEYNTISGGIELIVLEYLGFDAYELIYMDKSDKEMLEILKKYFTVDDEDCYIIDLSNNYDELQEFIKEQGIYDYVCEVYKLVCKKINEIEKTLYVK